MAMKSCYTTIWDTTQDLVDDHRASEPFAREHVTLITKFGQV